MANTFVVNNNEGTHFINPEEIIYIKAENSSSIVKLFNGRQIKVSKNTRNLERLFPDANFFFRVHRSWLVNLNFMTSLLVSENREADWLMLEGGDTVPVVRSKKKELIRQLLNCMDSKSCNRGSQIKKVTIEYGY